MHKVILLPLRLSNDIPEVAGLDIVIWSHLIEVVNGLLSPLLVLIRHIRRHLFVGELAVRRWVVRVRSVVPVDSHEPVALEGVECVEWCVDWDLLIIDTESVTLGIWV